MKKVFSGFVPGGRYRLPFIFKNSNLDFSCILVQQHQLKEEKIRSIDIFIGWAAIVPVGGIPSSSSRQEILNLHFVF